MKTFVVTGCSLALNGPLLNKHDLRSVLTPGEEVTEEMLSSKAIKKLLEKGQIRVKGGEVEADPEKIETLKAHDVDLDKGQKVKVEQGKPIDKHQKPVGLWNVDPAILESKSLEALNVMIAERDPKLEAFSNRDEAVKRLTSDYVAPKAPVSKPPKK